MLHYRITNAVLLHDKCLQRSRGVQIEGEDEVQARAGNTFTPQHQPELSGPAAQNQQWVLFAASVRDKNAVPTLTSEVDEGVEGRF